MSQILRNMRTCPTPRKLRYPTQRAAEQAMERSAAQFFEEMRAYRCRCKWWHLSRKRV